jgi:serine/threonine protein kinase
LRQHGYLHRDFKPENILLKDNQPKIADLGFSIRTINENIKESFNIGSPLYMAP